MAFARKAAQRPAGGQDPRPERATRDRRDATLRSSTRRAQLAAKVRRHQTAPLNAVAAIEAATTLPYEEGCRRERELFVDSVSTEQAKALIHAFFAERAATKLKGVPRGPQATADRTRRGHRRRHDGRRDRDGLRQRRRPGDDHGRDSGGARPRAGHDPPQLRFVGQARPAHRGRRDEAPRRALPRSLDDAGSRRRGSHDRGRVRGHGAEEAGLRESSTRSRKPGAVLATNTSTLDIDAIAAGDVRVPKSVVGLHFFSPANVMRLVEVVRGGRRAPDVLATSLAFGKKLGKVGVWSATARASSAIA